MNGEKNPSEESFPESSSQTPNYVGKSDHTPTTRLLVGAILITLILGGSSWTARYFWLNQKEAERRIPPSTIPSVNGIRLQATNFTLHLPSQGRVQARALTSINPEISGRIISIEPIFKEGGFFQPGQNC